MVGNVSPHLSHSQAIKARPPTLLRSVWDLYTFRLLLPVVSRESVQYNFNDIHFNNIIPGKKYLYTAIIQNIRNSIYIKSLCETYYYLLLLECFDNEKNDRNFKEYLRLNKQHLLRAVKLFEFKLFLFIHLINLNEPSY